ncbi:fibroblast growth factor 18-like [Dendronephthya gigantea]|uniref:fibroblast growth factor 18-like n=1 Tax=Dendronephthya gigantea TaxID=151771 RepID=UPI00106D9E11|nr:fibroblast growth factor 18-like [Dendronephthya gigantea]
MNFIILIIAFYLQFLVTRVSTMPLAGSTRTRSAKTISSKEEHLLRTALRRQKRFSHQYFLYTFNTGQFVKVTSKEIHANSNKTDKYAELILTTTSIDGQLKIQGKHSKRYVCMNKTGRVISKKVYREKQCLFIMKMEDNGYTTFRLASNEKRYLGFKRNGYPRLGHETESHHKAALMMKERIPS